MSTAASHGQCLAKVSLGQPLPTNTDRKHTFGKKRIPLRRRVVLHHVLRIQSQAGFGRGTVKLKEEEEEEIDVEVESEPSSGTEKFIKLPGTIKLPGAASSQVKGRSQAKSNKVVFVAGATGKVGSRTVRELLKLGFQVRAGTRNTEKAQALFEDVTQSGAPATGSNDTAPLGFFSPAKLFGFLKPKSGKVLEIVECDLEDEESIEPALGNAGVVICCIGASEKEVLDVSGPYRIDFKATANLIDAASSAQVDHFVLLTSLGTQKFGFPAAVLNLFWGVLVWKAKAEKALLQSGLPYTIVRPGGMERPKDDYKETHNLLLAEADKLFGGQVSNLQVAELLASIVENPDVSVNKIIEAVAETTAPLRPIRELLEEISVKDDIVSSSSPQKIRTTRPAKADVAPQKVSKRQEEKNLAEEKRALALKEKEEKRIQAEKLADEKLAKAQKEKEEKRLQAENDEKEKLRLQALRKKYEAEIEAAREKEEAANSAAAAALAEKVELEKRVAEVRAKAEAAALAASQAKAVEAAVLAAARKGNVLSDAEKEKIMESVKVARLPKEESKEFKASPKKKPAFSFFGRAPPSTETATDVEPPKETEEDKAKVATESKAKAKAEKQAAAKTVEQKKQEEKARKEEEAKKLAEQETAKALEAKKKAEQEKLEKEAKEKAEKEAVEAKKKEEAEAKRKEEEAEARKKEEAEAQRKEELAEAKKKEEQEKAEKEAERIKREAEEKAKAKAEQDAEAKRKEEELAERIKREAEEKAKAKAEQDAEAKRKEEELAEAKRKEEQEKAKAEQEAALAAAAATEAERKEEELGKVEEASAPARRKGFRWFWQPAEPDTPDKEQTTIADVTDVPVQANVAEQLPPSSTPLSPYTRYPGLKPPIPPIASPPSTKAEKVDGPKIEETSSAINRVEQIAEEVGLLAEKGKEVVVEEQSPESQEDIEARTRQVQETAAREREALEKAQASISFKWLWEKADSVDEISASTPSKKEDSVSLSKKEEPASSVKEQVVAALKSDDLPRSSRPLSPYAQFPGLKPPAPPRPSPPVPISKGKEFEEAEPLPNSSTPLSPYPGFPNLKPPPSPTPLCNEAVNGAVPENVAETGEEKPEPALSSGFKWPWQQ